MTAVHNGQIDATLQDLPAALFYRDRFPSLELAGGRSDTAIMSSSSAGATRPARRARPGLGATDRLGRRSAVSTRNTASGTTPSTSLTGWTARGMPRPGDRTVSGWRLALAVRSAPARRRAHDDRALGRVDAAGDALGLFVALGRAVRTQGLEGRCWRPTSSCSAARR